MTVSYGKPYAGKLHVRFDEGAGAPDNKGRPALLYLGTDNRAPRAGLAFGAHQAKPALLA